MQTKVLKNAFLQHMCGTECTIVLVQKPRVIALAPNCNLYELGTSLELTALLFQSRSAELTYQHPQICSQDLGGSFQRNDDTM